LKPSGHKTPHKLRLRGLLKGKGIDPNESEMILEEAKTSLLGSKDVS
jgi:hypothetical protein